MRCADGTGLLEACRVLFGRECDPRFLSLLEEPRLRAAWRRQALATHPDRFPAPQRSSRATERFLAAREAYALLREHLARRARPQAAADPRHERRPPAPRPRPARAAPRPETAPRAPLPRRRLRFAEYLYFSRAISFESLVAAVCWQRGRRERFCEVLVRWGVLDYPGAADLLRRRRPGELVGDAGRRLGLLNAFQVCTVLRHQQRRQPPIGSYFVAHGLLSPGELVSHLRACARHNAACARS